MSYRHIHQPLNRTIHNDLIILRMVDDGVMPKQIPRLIPTVTAHMVYHAIYRRKTFPDLYSGKVMATAGVCHCEKRIDGGWRYCRDCINAWAREWRKGQTFTEEQKFKMNCRSATHVYVKRGKIEKKPCDICGDGNVEAHHHDYSKPLEVRWLCRKHHRQHHRDLKKQSCEILRTETLGMNK